MGSRYCPKCKEMIDAKVLSSGYSQVAFKTIRAKRRKVIHREEDGGCGKKWSTVEIPEEFILMGTTTESIGEDSSLEGEGLE